MLSSAEATEPSNLAHMSNLKQESRLVAINRILFGVLASEFSVEPLYINGFARELHDLKKTTKRDHIDLKFSLIPPPLNISKKQS